MSVTAMEFDFLFGAIVSLLTFLVWFIFFRRVRHWSWRVAVSSCVGLCFVAIAMWNFQWIVQWHLIVNRLLVAIAPQWAPTFLKIDPIFFLLAAWIAGFALSFQAMLLWNRRTKKAVEGR